MILSEMGVRKGGVRGWAGGGKGSGTLVQIGGTAPSRPGCCKGRCERERELRRED